MILIIKCNVNGVESIKEQFDRIKDCINSNDGKMLLTMHKFPGANKRDEIKKLIIVDKYQDSIIFDVEICTILKELLPADYSNMEPFSLDRLEHKGFFALKNPIFSKVFELDIKDGGKEKIDRLLKNNAKMIYLKEEI